MYLLVEDAVRHSSVVHGYPCASILGPLRQHVLPPVRRSIMCGIPLSNEAHDALGGLSRILRKHGMSCADIGLLVGSISDKICNKLEFTASMRRPHTTIILMRRTCSTMHQIEAALLDGTCTGAPHARSGLNHPTAIIGPFDLAVLDGLARGSMTAEIAKSLNYSPQTVSTHINRLFRRFEVANRTALVARAYDLGVLPQAPAGPVPVSGGQKT